MFKDGSQKMKRSDMVSKIASVILNFNEPNSYVDRKKALEIAEVILQVQEENGMLPPPKKTDVVTSYLVYCYYPEVIGDATDQLDRVNSQLWGLEDETK